MARGSYRQDEATAAKTGEDKRRTVPKDQGPYSPKEIDRLYAKDKIDGHKHADGDGFFTKQNHAIDGRLPTYDNDTPSTGRRGWLRGADGNAAEGHLAFDSYSKKPPLRDRDTQPDTGLDGSRPERPAVKNSMGTASGGLKNTASGQDMKSSPFSKAHFVGRGER
jgi:hypothetical protein